MSQGRGALASQWLSTHRTDWSLWLDDDIEIEWGALREFVLDAMASDHSYVCAQYVAKAPRSGVLTARLEGSAGMLGAGGYHRIVGSGFGCVMVRRSVFERMDHMLPLVRWARTDCVGRPYFLGIVVPTKEDPEGPRIQLGEDYAFGFRARAIGVELYCDTRVRVWHHGDYRYGLEDADSSVKRFGSIHVAPTEVRTTEGPVEPEPIRTLRTLRYDWRRQS
ncbi:MAG: hypothetical protein A2Y74_05310 [Actinobacteria bacterium RBG_13_63_9]|nr:MAG: hypothetical protein A2Y74_05310 [Actinobacteria bacterium RBG_13_63_9]